MPRKSKVKKVVEPVVEEKKEEVLPVQVEPVKIEEKKEKKTITVKKERKPNAWLIHTKKVQKENPGISYREVLKIAKTSYRKDSPKK